jgi:hypothetical protein
MPRKNTEVQEATLPAEAAITDELLMERYFKLKDWIKSEDTRYAAHIDPHKKEMEIIEQEFLKRLNERGADASKTDNGTAYKSTLLNVSISPEALTYKAIDREAPMVGREALLEFALDHWEAWGSDMLMIGAQKDAVKKYMEENGGNPPPGVKTAFFTRVNLRRS